MITSFTITTPGRRDLLKAGLAAGGLALMLRIPGARAQASRQRQARVNDSLIALFTPPPI